MDFKKPIEEEIVEQYCTEYLIEKTYQKIVVECDGWNSVYIPRLLETVYHDFVVEEIWRIIKKHKAPTINFGTLRYFVIRKIKEIKKELFV